MVRMFVLGVSFQCVAVVAGGLGKKRVSQGENSKKWMVVFSPNSTVVQNLLLLSRIRTGTLAITTTGLNCVQFQGINLVAIGYCFTTRTSAGGIFF